MENEFRPFASPYYAYSPSTITTCEKTDARSLWRGGSELGKPNILIYGYN